MMKGITKLEHPEALFVGVLFFLTGLVIIIGAIIHDYVEKKIGHIKPYIFLFEGIVFIILGYVYITEGKHYLQYGCFIAATGFMTAFFVHRKKLSHARGEK